MKIRPYAEDPANMRIEIIRAITSGRSNITGLPSIRKLEKETMRRDDISTIAMERSIHADFLPVILISNRACIAAPSCRSIERRKRIAGIKKGSGRYSLKYS